MPLADISGRKCTSKSRRTYLNKSALHHPKNYIWKTVHFTIPRNIFRRQCTLKSQRIYFEDSALQKPKEYIWKTVRFKTTKDMFWRECTSESQSNIFGRQCTSKSQRRHSLIEKSGEQYIYATGCTNNWFFLHFFIYTPYRKVFRMNIIHINESVL